MRLGEGNDERAAGRNLGIVTASFGMPGATSWSVFGLFLRPHLRDRKMLSITGMPSERWYCDLHNAIPN
jgi:hypothetical protein